MPRPEPGLTFLSERKFKRRRAIHLIPLFLALSHHETQSAAVETLQTWSSGRFVFAIFGCLSEGTAVVVEFYVSGVAILIGAILIRIVFIIDRQKTETESEQDA